MSSTPIAAESSECLLRLVEAAPQVRRRYQFFVWSQGDLQRWLPHKLLLCGLYDRHQRDLSFDIFNSIPLPESLTLALRDARSSLVRSALQAWLRARQQPVRMSLTQAEPRDGLWSALIEQGYEEVLVHGLSRPGRPEEVESFFIFSQVGRPYNDEAVRALDMLLPCVHLTYQRVCVTERQMAGMRDPGGDLSGNGGLPRAPSITTREREILLWVRDGLSNQQISEKLGISALTVKNHVQKILRKLGAANRAQAVAKAMTMNALGHAQVHPDDASY